MSNRKPKEKDVVRMREVVFVKILFGIKCYAAGYMSSVYLILTNYMLTFLNLLVVIYAFTCSGPERI